jgi:hypothetical protein
MIINIDDELVDKLGKEVIENKIKELIKKEIEKLKLEDLWDNIPEVEPDAWDLGLLEEIEKNPECRDYDYAR